MYVDPTGNKTYFVIYYDNPEKDKDGSFKAAAETWKITSKTQKVSILKKIQS